MDRRFFTRIQIPGTTIRYKKLGVSHLTQVLSKPVNLSNLSKSGICFSIGQELMSGEYITMKIRFPDGKKLKLKGRIRWNHTTRTAEGLQIGIQFFPFGTLQSHNSIKALEYLRNLDGLHMRKLEKN